MKSIVTFVVLLLSASAFADQCAWVTEAQAQKAVQLIQRSVNPETGKIEVLSFCQLCGDFEPRLSVVTSLSVDETGDREAPKQVMINGENADLAYTYARVSPRAWVNVSSRTTCRAVGTPQRISETSPGQYEISF